MKIAERALRPNDSACPESVARPPSPPQALPPFFAERRTASRTGTIDVAKVRHLVFELEDPIHQAADYGRVAELLTEAGHPLTSGDVGPLYRLITDALGGAKRAETLWRELHQVLNAEEVSP